MTSEVTSECEDPEDSEGCDIMIKLRYIYSDIQPKLLCLQLRGQLTFGWLAHLNGCFYISRHFCHPVRSFQFSSDWRTLGCEPYGHTKDDVRIAMHCAGFIQDFARHAFTGCASLHYRCCCINWWSGMEVSSGRCHTCRGARTAGEPSWLLK